MCLGHFHLELYIATPSTLPWSIFPPTLSPILLNDTSNHLFIQVTRDIFLFRISHLQSSLKHFKSVYSLLSPLPLPYTSIILPLIFTIASILFVVSYFCNFLIHFLYPFKNFGACHSMPKTFHGVILHLEKIYSLFLGLHQLHYLNTDYFSSEWHYYCKSNNDIVK